MSLALPQNVYLMTLEPWRENGYLIRFEHLLEKDEDPKYSKPVTFNLSDVFQNLFDIESVRETNLAANQWLSDVHRFKFRKEENVAIVEQREEAENEVWSKEREAFKGHNGDEEEINTISLNPMQIRSFVITVNEQV